MTTIEEVIEYIQSMFQDTSFEDHEGSPIIEFRVSESEWDEKLKEWGLR
jgi:hypothetical protein